MKAKKAYNQPKIKKVRLEVKQGVLAVCFTSTVTTPFDSPGGACQDPTVGCESDQ